MITRYMVIGDAKPTLQTPGDGDWDIDDCLSPSELDRLASYVEDDTDFVEYMDAPLRDKMIPGAYMKFKHVKGTLYAFVIYEAKDELSISEQGELVEYTQGQWSDGIGEGFEQNACMQKDDGYYGSYSRGEYYISPWHPEQVIKVEEIA